MAIRRFTSTSTSTATARIPVSKVANSPLLDDLVIKTAPFCPKTISDAMVALRETAEVRSLPMEPTGEPVGHGKPVALRIRAACVCVYLTALRDPSTASEAVPLLISNLPERGPETTAVISETLGVLCDERALEPLQSVLSKMAARTGRLDGKNWFNYKPLVKTIQRAITHITGTDTS